MIPKFPTKSRVFAGHILKIVRSRIKKSASLTPRILKYRRFFYGLFTGLNIAFLKIGKSKQKICTSSTKFSGIEGANTLVIGNRPEKSLDR